jgi:hypothetical protein
MDPGEAPRDGCLNLRWDGLASFGACRVPGVLQVGPESRQDLLDEVKGQAQPTMVRNLGSYGSCPRKKLPVRH